MPPESNILRNDRFWKERYIEWKDLITRNVHVKYDGLDLEQFNINDQG